MSIGWAGSVHNDYQHNHGMSSGLLGQTTIPQHLLVQMFVGMNLSQDSHLKIRHYCNWKILGWPLTNSMHLLQQFLMYRHMPAKNLFQIAERIMHLKHTYL